MIVVSAPLLVVVGLGSGNIQLIGGGCVLTGIEVLKLLVQYCQEYPLERRAALSTVRQELKEQGWPHEEIDDLLGEAKHS